MTGQLSLFASSRQRGRKPPRAYEFAVHCLVADTLARWAEPGWDWTHFPAGELRDRVTASRLKRMGLKPGWPDFVLLDPEGRFHGLELKRKGNTLTEAQVAFLDRSRARGTAYEVAWSAREAIDILKLWGAVRRVRIAA
jgi:hypothetical protein